MVRLHVNTSGGLCEHFSTPEQGMVSKMQTVPSRLATTFVYLVYPGIGRAQSFWHAPGVKQICTRCMLSVAAAAPHIVGQRMVMQVLKTNRTFAPLRAVVMAE